MVKISSNDLYYFQKEINAANKLFSSQVDELAMRIINRVREKLKEYGLTVLLDQESRLASIETAQGNLLEPLEEKREKPPVKNL